MEVRSARTRTFGVWHVALLLPWITAVVAARLPIRDNSFLWHVAAGRLQLESGEVLTADPFSFTFLGAPWRTQSWLIELLYAWLEQPTGLGFVTPFMIVVTLVTFGAILLATFRVTGSLPATAVVGVLTAWHSAAFLSPRPVIVSFLLLALAMVACLDRRLRWTLPLVIWVWAAIHGSFLLGIGLAVLVGFQQRDRRRLVDVAAMTAAATLTAHGLGIWQILSEFIGNRDALDLITEWATPDLTHVALVPFLIGVIMLLVAGTFGRLHPRDLLVVVPFVVFAMTATRAVFPAWIVLGPFAGLAVRSLSVVNRPQLRDRAVIPAIAAVLVVTPFVLPIDNASRLSEEFPTHAASTLDAARVFHDDYAGGYLIYRFTTDRLVFVDDRAELFGADHMQAMTHARRGTYGWRDVFAEWDITQALVRTDDRLVDALSNDGWVIVHVDPDWLVLETPGRG